ncbi:MAG: histidine phosphatase family protein [Phycisphaerae bacterium]|nr:histidine phosphatase family protein [Phycisphaerae bacterium]
MARDSKVDVVLVRSGRTDWDDQRRVQGRGDLPLSASGRAGVVSLIAQWSKRFNGRTPAVIVSGPDESSLQTAGLWAEALGGKIRTVPELISMNLGLWEGLLESEIRHRFPGACREWEEQPSNIHPPEGESFVEAEARVRSALAEVLERANGRPIFVVCRPIPYAMGVCWLSNRPACDLWKIVEDGPDVTRVELEREHLHQLVEDLKAGA